MRTTQWEFLIQQEVKEQQLITLPPPVQRAVATEHLVKGPAVFWNIENDDRYVILSDSPLEQDQYTNLGVFKIFDIDHIDETPGRIRPPAEVTDYWSVSPEPGERVFFLSHERMLYGSKATVYLLSERQILDMLPTNPRNQAYSERSVSDTIFDVPGFSPHDAKD